MKFITSVRGDYWDDTLDYNEDLRPKKGLFARLKETLTDLMFEEEEEERPIGMSQLMRKTFAPADPQQPGVFFKHAPTFQDYRFLNRLEANSHGSAGRY